LAYGSVSFTRVSRAQTTLGVLIASGCSIFVLVDAD
jgi:hypothetical protein